MFTRSTLKITIFFILRNIFFVNKDLHKNNLLNIIIHFYKNNGGFFVKIHASEEFESVSPSDRAKRVRP